MTLMHQIIGQYHVNDASSHANTNLMMYQIIDKYHVTDGLITGQYYFNSEPNHRSIPFH